jgi:hypothetical protein
MEKVYQNFVFGLRKFDFKEVWIIGHEQEYLQHHDAIVDLVDDTF